MIAEPAEHRLTSRDGRTAILFRWRADRYEHLIEHRWQNGQIEPLISCEGSAEDAWPPSPPLQQLSTEQIADELVILGVGSGGTSHYSVCVRMLEDAANVVRLQFDWAVRLSKYPGTPKLTNGYGGEGWNVAANQSAGVSHEPSTDGDKERWFVEADIKGAERTIQWSYIVSRCHVDG